MRPTAVRSRSLTLCLALAAPALLAISTARADDLPPDPAGGKFTLEQATKGLAGSASAPLVAVIDTSKGKFTCELFDKQAPITVANFVGLARGVRPWLDPKTKQWVKKPFYDGLIFHRVIPGFMIQGGDPLGVGTGGPGYQFKDEIAPDLHHGPGTLAMANAGPNTNGSQFFIDEVEATWLDNHHTIFGQCREVETVTAIAAVPRDTADKPTQPVVIRSITFARGEP
jgi:peptidyl-prolyl cis-trans isomerase A (cyclophilin A)